MAQILLVEDDPTIARLARYCLEGEGHQVTVATDGIAGLQAAYAQRPDLILLDLMLPNLGGHLVSQALRADSRTRGVPIILLTGAGRDDSPEARAAAPDGYLQKPFTPTQLLEAVSAGEERGKLETEEESDEQADSGGR